MPVSFTPEEIAGFQALFGPATDLGFNKMEVYDVPDLSRNGQSLAAAYVSPRRIYRADEFGQLGENEQKQAMFHELGHHWFTTRYGDQGALGNYNVYRDVLNGRGFKEALFERDQDIVSEWIGFASLLNKGFRVLITEAEDGMNDVELVDESDKKALDVAKSYGFLDITDELNKIKYYLRGALDFEFPAKYPEQDFE